MVPSAPSQRDQAGCSAGRTGRGTAQRGVFPAVSQQLNHLPPAARSHWQDAASLTSSHFSLKYSSEKPSSREGSVFPSEFEGNEKNHPWLFPSLQEEKVGLCFEWPEVLGACFRLAVVPACCVCAQQEPPQQQGLGSEPPQPGTSSSAWSQKHCPCGTAAAAGLILQSNGRKNKRQTARQVTKESLVVHPRDLPFSANRIP